jgi:YVTN family beta-propeller protein
MVGTLARRACAAIVAAVLLAPASAAADTGPMPVPGETRPVILVGNNWDGTTDVLDPYTYERLDRIDVVPDIEERRAEIMRSPDRFGYFLGIREVVGEGHDQFNDDVFSSHDGRRIFVSRPSLADVVAIDLATNAIVWRTPVAGYRADHMAISPDGTRLLVSASTANVVQEIDTETGRITGQFASGDTPHENNYSQDGTRVFHASIGRVYTATDRPAPVERATKGARVFQVVDARTLEVLRRIDMGQKLEEAGHPGYSSAVRPMALSPDERFVYFQVSFHHGFVEYDLAEDRVTRVAHLPLSSEAAALQREQYLLDSAHHGLAMNPEGTKLCVAGTMSDYAAIVDRRTFAARILASGRKPYWATNSADGRHCYVSSSGDDWLTVISYETEEVVAHVPVGDHPQRVRNGVASAAIYPMSAAQEPFRLATFRERSPIGVAGGDENVGCQARRAAELRLARCVVRVYAPAARGRRARLVAAGTDAPALARRALTVDVDFNRAGRRLLRRRGGFAATIVVRGTDYVGRTRTLRERAVFRRAR